MEKYDIGLKNLRKLYKSVLAKICELEKNLPNENKIEKTILLLKELIEKTLLSENFQFLINRDFFKLIFRIQKKIKFLKNKKNEKKLLYIFHMIITNFKKKRELEEIFILEGFLDLIKLTKFYLEKNSENENDIIFQFLNIIKSILLKIDLLLIFDKIKNEIILILENNNNFDNLVNTCIYNIFLILIKSKNLQIRFFVKKKNFYFFFIILFKKFRIYLVELEKLLFGKNIILLRKTFSKIQDFIYFIDDILNTNKDEKLKKFINKIFFKEILFDIILPNFCEIGNLNCLGQNISLMILNNLFIIVQNQNFKNILKKSLFKTNLKIGSVNYLYLEKYFLEDDGLINKILDIDLFEENYFKIIINDKNENDNLVINSKNENIENSLKNENIEINNEIDNLLINSKNEKIQKSLKKEISKNCLKKENIRIYNLEKTLFLQNLIQLLQSKDDNLNYLTTNFIIILLSENFEFSEISVKKIILIIFERLNSYPILRLITYKKNLDLIFLFCEKKKEYKNFIKKKIKDLSENIIINIKKLIINKNYENYFSKYFRKIIKKKFKKKKNKKKKKKKKKKMKYNIIEIICIYNYQFENEQDYYFKNINIDSKYNLNKKETVFIYLKMFIYIFNLRYQNFIYNSFDDFYLLDIFIDFSKNLENKKFYFLQKNDIFEFEINKNPFIVFFTGFLDKKKKIKIFFSGLGYKFFIFQNFGVNTNNKKMIFISNFADFEILEEKEENSEKLEFFNSEEKDYFNIYFNSEEDKIKIKERIGFILKHLYQKEKDILMAILLRFGQELSLIK